MKNWEDMIKERLEGYESPLPEDSLERFREALSDKRARRRGRSLGPVFWLSATGLAAASLAAVFFLNTPEAPGDVINVITGPPVADIPEVVSDQAVTSPEIKEVTPVRGVPKAIKSGTTSPVSEVIPADDEPETLDEPAVKDGPDTKEEPVVEEEPPVREWPAPPTISEPKTVRIKTGPLVAGVAGTGLLGALAAILPNSVSMDDKERIAGDFVNLADETSVTNPHNHNVESAPDEDLTVTNDDYQRRLPLKYGLSAKVPMNDRLALTAGASYSTDQCLWIPVRLDWTFASWKSLDFYAGAGFEGSFDLLRPIKEGAGLALTGASGAQWNLHKWLGVYLEPGYSWNILQRNGMLAVSTGLRINLGK